MIEDVKHWLFSIHYFLSFLTHPNILEILCLGLENVTIESVLTCLFVCFIICVIIFGFFFLKPITFTVSLSLSLAPNYPQLENDTIDVVDEETTKSSSKSIATTNEVKPIYRLKPYVSQLDHSKVIVKMRAIRGINEARQRNVENVSMKPASSAENYSDLMRSLDAKTRDSKNTTSAVDLHKASSYAYGMSSAHSNPKVFEHKSKSLHEVYKVFCRAGCRHGYETDISLFKIERWFRQAKLYNRHLSPVDTTLTYKLLARNKRRITEAEFHCFLQKLCERKHANYASLVDKLIACRPNAYSPLLPKSVS